ncbi:MAG: hypothetical protein QOJ12_3344 [Thermoleophilales bacterium]|jgi:hypothetical protein|nr:hypothetical protein [Thermoleophilales bacterium]
MKKALTVIPLAARIARRRRRKRSSKAERAERGARIGVPALIGLGSAAVAFVLRRRKRSAAGHDVSPQELQRTDPPRADAASRDADVATGAESTTEPTGASADTLGASAVIAGTAPAGSVMPDTGADDPLVREETNAAAAEAARIGSTPPSPAAE